MADVPAVVVVVVVPAMEQAVKVSVAARAAMPAVSLRRKGLSGLRKAFISVLCGVGVRQCGVRWAGG